MSSELPSEQSRTKPESSPDPLRSRVSVPAALGQDSSGSLEAISTLANSHRTGTLVSLLEGDFQTRWDACKVLVRYGDEILPDLLSLLDRAKYEEDEELCWFLARLLGKFRHPKSLVALIGLMEDPDSEEVSAEAVRAIGGFGASAIAPLTDLMQHPQYLGMALQALAIVREPESLPLLLQACHSDDAEIRTIALDALSAFPPTAETIAAAIAGLQDRASIVRQVAVAGIGISIATHPDQDWVTYLQPLLGDLEVGVACGAARALARLHSEAAVTALGQLLDDPIAPLPLQLEAARSLGYINLASGLERLQARLLSSEAMPMELQLECLRVLGRTADPSLKSRAAQLLHRWLERIPITRIPIAAQKTLAHSLGQLGQPSSLDSLVTLLASEREGVQLHAIAAIVHLQSASLLHNLSQLAQSAALSPEQARGIAQAMDQLQ